jgi:hypothetical protein
MNTSAHIRISPARLWICTRFLVCAIAGAAAVHVLAQTPPINWVPTSFEWSCAQQGNGERLCSLTARGPEPAAAEIGNTASGWFRVYRVVGANSAIPILTTPFSMQCVRGATEFRCDSVNALKLGASVTPLTSGTNATSDIRISTTVQTQLADWNNVGGPLAEFEGLVALRMLNGFRGDRLVDGLTLSSGVTAESIEQLAYIAKFNDWFTYAESGTQPRATVGGLIYVRCLLGLRGTALTGGITASTPDIDEKCTRLTALE